MREELDNWTLIYRELSWEERCMGNWESQSRRFDSCQIGLIVAFFAAAPGAVIGYLLLRSPSRGHVLYHHYVRLFLSCYVMYCFIGKVYKLNICIKFTLEISFTNPSKII